MTLSTFVRILTSSPFNLYAWTDERLLRVYFGIILLWILYVYRYVENHEVPFVWLHIRLHRSENGWSYRDVESR